MVLHYKHEVSNLYRLYFTVDSGFIVVVDSIAAISFAQLSRYVNMLGRIAIISEYWYISNPKCHVTDLFVHDPFHHQAILWSPTLTL